MHGEGNNEQQELVAYSSCAHTHAHTHTHTHTCLCACRHGEGNNEQQELVYEKLPADICSRFVLLLDPVLGTGVTACRVIKVLQVHDHFRDY